MSSPRDAPPQGTPPQGTPERRTVAIGSAVGTTIENYDFTAFGTAAALSFGPAFFPGGDATAGTLASFATLGVGFAVRPIGGLIGGHLGDRVGRRPVLLGALVVMGLATVAICELFGVGTRSSGASIGYQVSAAVAGFVPFAATAAGAAFGWPGVAGLTALIGVLGFVSVAATRETWDAARRAVPDASIMSAGAVERSSRA